MAGRIIYRFIIFFSLLLSSTNNRFFIRERDELKYTPEFTLVAMITRSRRITIANETGSSSKDAGKDWHDNLETKGKEKTARKRKTASKPPHPGKSSLPKQKQKQKQTKLSFEERCNDLIQFRDKFGHCNVPRNFSDNPSMSIWCTVMRTMYSRLQKGRPIDRNLSPDRISRLEEIGFNWDVNASRFEKHCCDLEAFNDINGHCHVPDNYPDNQSLSKWCKLIRFSYHRIQQPGTPPKGSGINMSTERIARLEEIGFEWEARDDTNEMETELELQMDAKFEKHCCDLEAFKDIHGHCNVPNRYKDNPGLGLWCSDMRKVYKKIQQGLPVDRNLSPGRIELLEDIGFKWVLNAHDAVFEKRCCDLETFKSIHGHCDVPQKCPDNPLLGRWCHNVRDSYEKVKKGQKPKINISPERITRLEEIGFRWELDLDD